jgi:hypothetical protein
VLVSLIVLAANAAAQVVLGSHVVRRLPCAYSGMGMPVTFV